MAATVPSTYVREDRNVPFVIRVLWFFLIGWHVTFWWVLAAWVFNITIIGLPVGVWMLNRVPLVLTLRMPRGYTVTQVEDGKIVERYRSASQHFWLLRLVYFILIGWWFSLIWALFGWLLCVIIIGLPVGVLMLNRLPNVTTLMRQ
jgi:uncharacterized membrane protein YccF (DUF307 family)